ncbi:endoglucanase 2-like protein [Tanacetum coccineum]
MFNQTYAHLHLKNDSSYVYIKRAKSEIEVKCLDYPEAMIEKRPAKQINTSTPGIEVAAETAAAMTSASLVFNIEDLTARTSLKFKIYYNSTGYGDELLWAASWLYHSTTDRTYIDYVTGTNGESFANWGSLTWFS